MTDLDRPSDQESSTTARSTGAEPPSGWGALFTAALGPTVVMAGGTLLYAMNLYFTAALMPTVVADIDGERYYAWAATGYLITTLITTMLANRFLGTWGAGRSYVVALLIFGAGTSVCAVSSTMEWFIAGRVIQGLGVGLLAALGYATIRTVLPEHLWTRATGLVSGMFAIGALVGPAIGGAFGQAESWRPAFWLLVAAAAILVIVVLAGISQRRPERPHRAPVPVWAMLLLTASAAALSISQMVEGGLIVGLIGLGVGLLVLFLAVDAHSASGVLPRATYQRGPSLKWVYLTVSAISATSLSEYFIPDFGQRLADLGPLLAGFLGAILSLGWAISQLVSVNAAPQRITALVRTGVVIIAVALTGFALLLTDDASTGRVVLWALLLFIIGVGIGMAFPHLTVLAMRSSDDPVEGGKAAAAISTTQLIGFTLTSAVAGNLLLLGDSTLASARSVIGGIALLAILGIGTAIAATRPKSRL